MTFSIDRAFLLEQCKAALAQDVFNYHTDKNISLIQMMSMKGKAFATDIPVITEYFSLLDYVLEKQSEIGTLPITVDGEILINRLQTAAYRSEDNKQCLLAIAVNEGELGYIAHWVADRIRSVRVSNMPGVLLLPFTVESHESIPFLLPDWCAAFYVDQNPDTCVPIITLQSVLTNNAIPGDWTLSALHRLHSYHCPVSKALAGAEKERP
ncbi:hypothetical protein [Serratia symbiotica]|uniref:hypothetical protein n=1 Tax=Serratia symbiotica TaxID=138074 RepID=UPI001320CDF4|nr:hypothetical protein [Serratia symbiotica]QTP13406.1 hypothetical protein GPZ83_0000260 [Serratia symbiotica]